jgi:hypothetical protein
MIKKRSARIQRNDAGQIPYTKLRGIGLNKYRSTRYYLVPRSHENGFYSVRSIHFWNQNRDLLNPPSSRLVKGKK